MRIKRVALLGCTGSIGNNAIKVLRQHKDEFKLALIANASDMTGLKKISDEFNVEIAYSGCGYFVKNGKLMPFDPNFLNYPETYESIDIVINGISGLAGLRPTAAVLNANKILATANKESLVCAGKLINKIIQKTQGIIRPVDSEHSTIWQCSGNLNSNIRSLVLTASGGAFRDYDKDTLEKATAKEALKHPNWKMGNKITIDCATLVNKGFEIIEAKNLFGTTDVEAVIHRESIIHSLVEMKDGALIAGLSYPDMTIPIQYALTYPERKTTRVKRLSLADLGKLTFDKIDENRFPCFTLCKKASEYGDYAGTVLNAANDVVVEKFLKGETGFYGIYDVIENALLKFGLEGTINSIEDVFGIDKEVREYILRSFRS